MGAKFSVYIMPLIDRAGKANVNVKTKTLILVAMI